MLTHLTILFANDFIYLSLMQMFQFDYLIRQASFGSFLHVKFKLFSFTSHSIFVFIHALNLWMIIWILKEFLERKFYILYWYHILLISFVWFAGLLVFKFETLHFILSKYYLFLKAIFEDIGFIYANNYLICWWLLKFISCYIAHFICSKSQVIQISHLLETF